MSAGDRLPRLSNATLAGLPPDVRRPAYDRGAVTTGIVHLGIGAFHRAHQAVFTDDMLAARPRLGHRRRESQKPRHARRARPAGRPLHRGASAPAKASGSA